MSSKILVLPLLLTLLCSRSGAQQPNGSNGEPRIQLGFEQRVRNENWNNLFDFSNKSNDEREQIRYRTMFWATVPLGPNVDFVAGLNQESNQKLGQPSVFDEIIFDRLYFDFKKLFVKGLALRIGRQNVTEGEGFLVFEGNPGDGSRSIYFNAANLSYTHKKSKLELIGILNPSRDRFLPRINDQHKPLQDWDDQAIGYYYTDKNLPKTSFETYYFYKKEVHDRGAALGAFVQPDRHISTLGGRVVQQLSPRLSATGEFAAQWGAQHPNTKIAAWGGYGYLKRTFQNPWKPYLQAGYWGFSGDNPASKDKIEGWDDIFARWPKWSEMYIYSQFKEVGVGYWTNTGMWQGETGFSPKEPLTCRITYYHMDAFHPFPGNPNIFGSGTHRGEMFQGRVDLVANRNWSGHLLYEHMLSGNYYTVHSPAYFLRFEVIYRILFSAPEPKL